MEIYMNNIYNLKEYNQQLLILGAGGFGHVIYELAQELGIFCKIDFLDDGGYDNQIIGCLSDSKMLKDKYSHAVVAIGNNFLRMEWLDRLKLYGYKLPILRHPSAWVSGSAKVGEGTMILQNSVVNSNAVIGRGVILNIGCTIDHDCTVRDGCHICLHSVVKNQSTVSPCTKLEAGAVYPLQLKEQM